MINNYNNFLRKKTIFSLYSTLEGYIYGNTDFILKLRSIRKNKIAKTILKIINDEKYIDDSDIKQNYFATTDSEDKVSFINQSKVDDNEDEYDIDPYTMKGRGEIKIGRIVKYLMKLKDKKVSDKEIEEFVNLYKAATPNNDIVFKIVKGDDIIKYYNRSNYYAGSGQLGNSCMSEVDESYLEIYSSNDNIQLLIYVDSDDKVHGRALLWKLSKSPCGAEYFMDRIYANRDSDMIKFTNFAEEKGYLHKKNTHGDVEFIWKGNNVVGEISVDLNDGDFQEYPFIDTLTFLSKDSKKLSNLPSIDCFMLNSTDGECNSCYECGGNCYECVHCLEEDICEMCEPCNYCFNELVDILIKHDKNFDWRKHLEDTKP